MKKIFLIGYLVLTAAVAYSQCSNVFPSTRGINGVAAPNCNDQSLGGLDPYESITFSVVAGTNYRVAINDINWNDESVSVYNNANGAFIGGSSGGAGASFTWTAGFTGTVRVVATRGCINTGSFGWFSGMNSATLSYRITGTGDPSVFGSNEWRVYAYTGRDRDLGGGLIYNGFYTESNVTYDSRNRWGANNSPSDASGYQGCPVGVDNHTVVSKRQGFPTGTYYIDVNNHDDEVRLFVNGTQVFENPGCCAFHCNVWSGTLNASSTVEFRHAEGGGGSHQGLNFKPYLINGINQWNFYAFAGRNRDNLAAITYNGYYTRNTLSFNTINDYGGSGSPAAAIGYIGCDPGVDNHTVVAMRQGFPCAVYTLNVTNHDDEASLIVNGTTVWTANCCNDNGIKWTGVLDASSTVEMRYAEGAGGNNMGLTLTDVTTALNGGTISFGGSTSACTTYDPPAFGNSAAASGGSSAAVNNGTTTYQWQLNGSDIIGATSTTYDPPALTPGSYVFRRVATDKCGNTAFSNSVTINVFGDPSVVISGGGTSIGCVGLDPSTLSSSVSGGTGSVSYQWQLNGSNISGATSSSYDPPAINTPGTYNYRLLYNTSGTGCDLAISNVISFTVAADPSVSIVTSSPTTACTGLNPTLFPSISGGSGTNSFQWQLNGSNIFGATSASYSPGPFFSSGTYSYRVLYNTSDAACTQAVSNTITFTIVQDPSVFISGGGTTTGCVGLNPSLLFSNASGGTGATSYQWQLNGVDIPGATSSDYNPPSLTTPGTYTYRLIFNAAGTNCDQATSNAITFTVEPDPTVSISGGGTTNACVGLDPTTLTSSVSGGTGNTSYQWQLNGSNISGATSSTYDPPALNTAGVYNYRLIYTRDGTACGSVTSNTITFNVDGVPTTANAGAPQTVCATSTTLSGNTPSVGSGTWTLVSGSGSISNPGSPNSGVTGLGVGANTFRWTISNGACPSSSDDVVITRDELPTTANAGFNQFICGTTFTLGGNTPVVGTGAWTLVSGSGTLTSPTSPNSGITGLGVGPNTFRWTISNGTCPPSTDEITITRSAIPSTADAGSDVEGCIDAAITLTAVAPTTGNGTWSWSPSAPAYVGGTSANDPDAQVVFSAGGTYTGTWTVSNGVCTPSTDDVIIDIYSSANNVVLATGTAVAVEVCEETPWTYYATPANPDEYVFAINKNGSTFDAEVTITDVPGTAPIESLGGLPLLRGTWLISRYWDVNVTSGSVSTPVAIRYFVDPAEITDAQNAGNAFVGSHPLASTITSLQWFKTPNGQTFNPSTDLINGDFTFAPIYLTPSSSGTINGVFYVEFGGLTGFSGGTGGFSVNDDNSPLPVELLSFEATAVDNQYIQLDWSTATEINNEGFEVLRSTDGSNFERIAWVPGNGNSSEVIAYSYNDKAVVKGQTYYYQLRQVDYDGQSELFNIVSAKLSGNDQFVIGNLIPNPSKGNDVFSVNVQASTATEEAITIHVYNHVGVKVAHEERTLTNGENNLLVNIGDLASGTYFINFESSFGIETRKLVIIR